jgi:hypothetical protein
MARASSSSFDSSSQIRQIVGDFVTQLSTLIEQDAVSRARQTILSAFSGGEATNLTINGKRRGRPPGRRSAVLPLRAGLGAGLGGPVVVRKRRKAPIQLCPVPGCSNRAAPVFGMVCAKHKDLPKSEIRKFREARRAKRGKGQASASAKANSAKPNRAKANRAKANRARANRAKPSSMKSRSLKRSSTKARKKTARQAKPARRQARMVRQVRTVSVPAAPRPVAPVPPKPPVALA